MSLPRRSIDFVLLAALASACRGDASAPIARAPGRLDAIGIPPASAAVGSTLTPPIGVIVSDSAGRAVQGVAVLFTVTAGNGNVSPRSITTDAAGRAEVQFTLGTIAGSNEVTASVSGLTTVRRFSSTGIAGIARVVTLGPRPARFAVGVDSLRVTTVTTDAFGNRTTEGVTVVARDTSLLSVGSDGFVRVRRRGGTTYLVAAVAGGGDSVLAVVLAPGDPPCTAVAVGRTLAVGEVVTDVAASGYCVRSTAGDEEYVLVSQFSSGTPSSTIALQVQGSGLGPVASSAPLAVSSSRLTSALTFDIADRQESFHRMLRNVERREMWRFAASARAWHAARDGAHLAPPASRTSTAVVPANTAVGDLVSLNVNANDFCVNPRTRTARVAAVSERAIVVADTGNPSGGFSDIDYRAIAVTFDTLVSAVDVAAFGEASDIDANGRVVIFFTRAVNELTPRGSASVILGFYYSRDLLPATGPQGNCPGSNVAEMFYLLVPDSAGTASDVRTRAFVSSVSNGTVAHEFQHLINASRRLYVNHAPALNEDTWLNEGLSHIAEELVFYRASGLEPRQNLGGSTVTAASSAAAFQQFQFNNLRRYATYLRSTASQGPIGVAGDDDLETRGAAWSLLRYAADRNGSTDGDFWYRLVNSQTTGLSNLGAVLGRDTGPFIRDWSISLYADDGVSGTGAPLDARYSQPSWNFRTLFPAAGSPFPLTEAANERRLSDGLTTSLTMRGGGTAFFRFGVPADREALVSVSAGAQPAPAAIQLAIVRLR